MSQDDQGQSERRKALSDDELIALYHSCDLQTRILISRFICSAASMVKLSSKVVELAAFRRDHQ